MKELKSVYELMMENIVTKPEITDKSEEKFESTLRPQKLDDYIGQNKVKESMKICIEAARMRNESLDHISSYILF